MNFKKMSAKALSVFMSLIMLFSVFAPAVSAIDADHNHATEKPDLNYVSLGDSMSNGYGLDGYAQNGYFDISENEGIGQYGKGAYTTQFAEYLTMGGLVNVNHIQLAASAMLSRDLLFLVGGGEYINDGYTGFIDYVGLSWKDLIDAEGNIINEEFFADLQALYIKSIANADVITMGLGNAEFGAYIMHKLMTCLGFGGTSYTEVIDYVQLENLMDTCDPALVEKVIELRDKYLAMLPQDEAFEAFENEQIETIANLFIYTILDFCNNYTKILDRIVELNPDVEIMIVGLMNTLTGVKFELNGETYDLGDYMGLALDIVNTHLTTYATVQVVNDEAYRNATIYYTAAPKVEVIIDTYADGLNDVVRARFHETIVGKNGKADGYVWGLLNSAGNVPYIALSEIEAFEANRIAYTEELAFRMPVLSGLVDANTWYNVYTPEMREAILAAYADVIEEGVMGYLALIQMYLAFEAAIVKASEGSTLSLGSFVAISDLSIVLEDVISAMDYDQADLESAILASKTNKDEAYKAFIAIVEDKLTGIYPTGTLDKDTFGDGSREYLSKTPVINFLIGGKITNNSNKILADFAGVYNTIEEFYDDVENLSEDELVKKIADKIYNDFCLNYYTEAQQAQLNYYEKATGLAFRIVNAASACLDAEYGEYYEYLYFVPGYASEAMCENEVLKGLLGLFGRCLIGNGIGAHPSENGHNTLFEAVRSAYADQYTTVDKTVDDLRVLCDYIYKNYDKFYAEAYKLAVKEGYIAQMDAYLVEAINAVRYAENWIDGYSEYYSPALVAQIAASADSTVASIEALRAVLANADKLDAELNATIVALAAQVESNLNEFATLIKIAATEVNAHASEQLGVVDAVVAEELAKALAVINAKVNAVLEAVAYVEAQVQKQIAIADAQIAAFVEIAEAYLVELFGEAVKTKAEAEAKIAEAIAYLNALIKAFLSNSAYTANYTVTADSYYVAIGGDDAVYAELLAEKMGLGADQFTTMGWDIDATIIAKADLITIGYTENMISGFATEQLFGYVAEYLDVTLRADINEFIKEAIAHVLGQLPFEPTEETMAMISETIGTTIDTTISDYMFIFGLEGAETTEMDWAALVGEANVAYVENALNAITNSLIAAGIPATYGYKIEVVDYLLENINEIAPEYAVIFSMITEESIKAMFGEYATYTVEFPVADLVAYAVESYLYSYVQFNVEYAKLVYAVNAINPDAQIVLLGNYSAFSGLGLDYELVVDGVAINFSDIFTAEIQNSANSYADEVFEAIFGTLEGAVDGDKIDSALGSVDSAITSGASTLYEIIYGILSDVENVRDYIDGTEVALPEIPAIPSCPVLENVLAMISKINPNVIKDIDWESIVGFDAIETTVAVAGAISNAVETIENTLVDLGIFETYTITLPTLDLIYANLDKFDAETRAMIESLDQAELRAMLGDLAEYVVEVKTISAKAVDTIKSYFNGFYNELAGIELTVFEGFNTTIDLGELLSAPTSIHALFYAYTMKNVIFVDISDAAIAYEATDLFDFIIGYLFDNTATDLSEAGHAYIAEQIYNALNVVCGHRINGHVCDYCGEIFSACADNDNDHKCDVCGEALTACADANNDHKCDVCGAELTKCADANNDHKCDVCGPTLTQCADANNEHKCDVCGTTMTQCADANNDHKCDVCGTTMTQCADANNDHKCDVCGETMTQCADANNDHNCDVCGTKLSECADANKDHKCDVCGATMTQCADSNNDHNCDVCGAKLSECADNDKDGKCDICGAEVAKEGLSTGAVIAIVAGSIVVAAGIGVGIFFGIKTGFFAKLFKKN